MVLRTFTNNRQCLPNVQPKQGRRSMNHTHISILMWHAIALVYYCYITLVSGAVAGRLVDLTHTFDESTIYWDIAKKLKLTVTHNGTSPGKDFWYQADEIAAGTHGGTHLDAPCHYAVEGWCVSDIPIERLEVWAAIIDISKDVVHDPDVHLSTEHLIKWEEMNGRIPDNSLLLIRTGWSRFWPDRLAYLGTEGQNVSLLKFPSIRPEAAKWLVDNRDIVGIGIDTLSIDMPTKSGRRTHITLLKENIYGLENVNLQQPLPPTGVKVYVMPMKLKGASGAPCRIIAEMFNDVTNGNIGLQNSNAWIWIMAIIAAFWTFKNGMF